MADRASLDVLRELFRDGSDDDLSRFLENFARAEIVTILLDGMTPGARRALLARVCERYASDSGETSN